MAEELWQTLRDRGITPYAPAFVQCRVCTIRDIPLRTDMLLGSGMPAWVIGLASRGSGPLELDEPQAKAARHDFPKAPRLQKASMQLALEAAKQENLVRTLAELDQDVLAAMSSDS